MGNVIHLHSDSKWLINISIIVNVNNNDGNQLQVMGYLHAALIKWECLLPFVLTHVFMPRFFTWVLTSQGCGVRRPAYFTSDCQLLSMCLSWGGFSMHVYQWWRGYKWFQRHLSSSSLLLWDVQSKSNAWRSGFVSAYKLKSTTERIQGSALKQKSWRNAVGWLSHWARAYPCLGNGTAYSGLGYPVPVNNQDNFPQTYYRTIWSNHFLRCWSLLKWF